jgi:hypothetical protein
MLEFVRTLQNAPLLHSDLSSPQFQSPPPALFNIAVRFLKSTEKTEHAANLNLENGKDGKQHKSVDVVY